MLRFAAAWVFGADVSKDSDIVQDGAERCATDRILSSRALASLPLP